MSHPRIKSAQKFRDLIQSRDDWRKRCLEAEGRQRMLYTSQARMMNFIKRNCKILEVPKEVAIKNTNYMQIDDVFYLIEPEISETIN